MASIDALCLRRLLAASQPLADAALRAPGVVARYHDILRSSVLSGCAQAFRGKSVLIGAQSQFACALALLELDGVASRLVLCPPDFTGEQLASAIAQAQVDIIVCDDAEKDFGCDVARLMLAPLAPAVRDETPALRSEWLLPTSGTTGAPKLVAYTLEALLGAIAPPGTDGTRPVWTTFYDIRRYGGLQVYLRAVTGGATLVLSEADEPLGDAIQRLREAGVTHITGTPSHWRRLLMSPFASMLSPSSVRLSGEIADRAILDALRAAYPQARIVHAYASTEAGVCFEVTDGLEGFPASYVGGLAEVDLRVVDGSLHVRSPRTATRYIGRDDLALRDAEGFVDTGDMVALREDRYFFLGRRAGVINIGGLKVHPEEIEQVINAHPAVRASLVRARRNPIMGDVVVADVVLKQPESEATSLLRDNLLAFCRAHLARHKVPAIVTFVPALAVSASGKLARRQS